ncbi:hypothetical protein THIX_90032 [Thiomonas sp. X19]|nr:hypothetical protein THIX_90032 [Thiomonas sp. X19]
MPVVEIAGPLQIIQTRAPRMQKCSLDRHHRMNQFLPSTEHKRVWHGAIEDPCRWRLVPGIKPDFKDASGAVGASNSIVRGDDDVCASGDKGLF